VRVKDFQLDEYKEFISDLEWEFGIKKGRLLETCENPYGSMWDTFPRGHGYAIAGYKNMKHYILKQLLAMLQLAASLASGLRLKHDEEEWYRKIYTVQQMIEEAKAGNTST
jgi:hypothetical protein